jgi:uncharacterized RDD family membrane protein YckC
MENSVGTATNAAGPIHATTLRTIDISGLAVMSSSVTLGNYFVLVLAILKIPRLITVAITEPTTAHFAVALIGIVLYALCGWAVWHATYGFDAIASRYTIPALVGILALSLITFPIGFTLPTIELFGPPAVLISLIMVIILRRIRLPGWNQCLGHMLRDRFVRAPGPELAPAKQWRGYISLTSAILWFIYLDFIPLDSIHGSQLWRSYNLLYGFGFVFLIYARKCWQPNYEVVIHRDPRPPILFLRSFEDDKNVIPSWSGVSANIIGVIGYRLFDYSLESRLATHFSQFGPFIALAAPKGNPDLGAIRVRLPDEKWQTSVTTLIGEAKFIILFVGVGKGLLWELEKIISSGQAGKALLLFPQLRHRFRHKPANAADRLRSVVASFQGTIWSSPASKLEESCKPENIRAIFCTADSLVAISSITPIRESHYVSAVLAHSMIQGERAEESAKSRQSLSNVGESTVGQPANISARLLATIIDMTLLVAVWVVLEYALGFGEMADILGSLAFVFGYYFVLEGWVGATVGKVIVNAAVISTTGQECSFRSSVVRNLFRFIDIISLYGIWVAIAKSSIFSQRLGDRFAGTIVVRKRRHAALRALLAISWIITLGIVINFGIKSVYANPHVTIGVNDEVYFNGSVNRETALALGEALRAVGFFTDKGAMVFVAKDGGEPVISFVLGDILGNQEDTSFAFELVGLQIAHSVGGLPIKIRLTDAALHSKKELSVGRVTVGTHDEIYYLGSATQDEAKTLGETLRKIWFFQNKGATVLLSEGSRTIMSFVVEEGTWDKPKSVRSFEEIARQAAQSISHFPITVHLCNSVLDTKKEFTVQ